MKRILEYYQGNFLAPTGGARGYLYSLKKGLESIDNNTISVEFLPGMQSIQTIRNYSKKTRNPVIRILLNVYRRIKHIKTILSILYCYKTPPIDIFQYDALYFHSTSDIYTIRKSLKKYKGVIFLTSHCPQPPADERIEGSSKIELFFFGHFYKKLSNVDEFAFKRADVIVFPCDYSEEPYYKYWKSYSDIKREKKSNFKYLLTGTFPARVETSKDVIRSKYNIPKNAFVISYVGRHNEVKGYDKLKSIGEKILNKYNNVYFLIAGKEGPIKSLKHDRWIEIGWTTEPHSYTASSDVFLLPNKETYFDLVLLEVLSIGIPIIASSTGGNRNFSNNEGIFLYEEEETAIKIIENLISKSYEERCTIGEKNIMLYKECFTPEVFAKNFLSLVTQCL